MNLEPAEAVLGEALAAGAIRSLDDAAQGAALPPTGPGRKRRIDHGVCHWSLAASAVWHLEPSFSDHLSVVYELPLDTPQFMTMPPRSKVCDASSDDLEQWLGEADFDPFWLALATGDVDKGWQELSNVAENCLCHTRSGDHPRSLPWSPTAAEVHSCKRFEGSASVRVLLKLQRQLSMLTSKPDQALRQKILKSLPRARAIVPDLPWTHEWDLEKLLGPVGELLGTFQEQETSAIRTRWKAMLREDTARQRAFVKSRADAQLEFEKRCPSQAEAQAAGPVHPSKVVRAQAQAWLCKWESEPEPQLDAIARVLQKVPAVEPTHVEVQFDPGALRAIAASFSNKAAGPDCWRAKDLARLPNRWWHAAAQLWQQVWDRGQVPKLWRFAKVTLIRKRGGPKTRPITLTQVIWRVGTKHIARALRPWTLKWASSSDHGGLPGRSTSDVLFQLQAAIKRGVNTAALMDVAGYFDSLNVPAMGRVFNRLGAPPQLLPLLESFYSDAKRYFNFEGSYAPGVHQVRSGFGQGCPLSPLAAAALSHCWSEYVKASSTNIGAQIFMDDRTLWIEPRGSLQDLDAALLASADFDQAFSLQLAEDKCFVAAKHHTEATRLLADKWHFLTCGSLELLGVSFDFGGTGAIPKFSLRKAVLRLRLLRWTQAATTSRIMLVRSLVMPCLAWAAGFARPSAKDVQAVQHEVRFLFSSGYGGDVATVAFYELLGWGLEPSFALDLGLCRLFWRWVSKPPVWLEEVPIGHCPGRWHAQLPETESLLARTGWWFSRDATALCRRDAAGALRTVHIGFESFRVVQDWLEGFYRQQYLSRCRRVSQSMHRVLEDGVARGLELPAPPRGFRIRLQGHKRVLADRSSLFHRRAAFLSGGTTWHFEKSVGPRRDQLHLRCLCGALRPSRAHLLWVCPSTADLRSGLDGPKHRGEERLLAKHLDEPPLPPPAVDAEGLIDEAAEAIQTELQESTSIAIATDGSAKDGVAAHAVVVNACAKAFAGGNSCEDQSSFRAELCALLLALKAVAAAASRGARGSITIAVDCSAALQARFSCPSLPMFSALFQQLSAEIRCFGIDLHFMKLPSKLRLEQLSDSTVFLKAFLVQEPQ
ncbi:Pol, partial [Symbiodinium sp. CCMP2592]